MARSLGVDATTHMEEAPPAYSSVDGMESVVGSCLNTLEYLKWKLGMRFMNYNNATKILHFRNRLRLYELHRMQDHTLPVRIHLIKLGIDVPCGVIDQPEGDYNLQHMKNIEIARIVNQEISFFVRVYQAAHNGRQPSQKDVIDYFDAWEYAVLYYEATTLKYTKLSAE
ncbi:hypothetical protein OCU04_001985 [Sclerotinia nivalis]|uniref:Uncharacterized protein n=1 Tax=Sclerotinia nivalis TaxID=352851 RepID=A0A9X0AZ73_9HELO|nr:hypothetical protein OCU04_001985 [Sclerotinia nivalis]